MKCLDCDNTTTGTRLRCEPCRVDRERRLGRERYRARVGIPLDAPIDPKRGRPRTRTEGDPA